MLLGKPIDRDTLSGLKWLIIPFSAVLLAFILCSFFIINAVVPSASMENTVKEGSLLIGNRLAYLMSEPENGDIIFFRSSELGEDLIIKRVIAVGGQSFMMKGGRVYIDGILLDEPYVSEFSEDDFPVTLVPEGYFIVLGDNRNNSYDSRKWETPFVAFSDVEARAELIYFPKFIKL